VAADPWSGQLTILPNQVLIPAVPDVRPLGVELTSDELKVFQQIIKFGQQSSVDITNALDLPVYTVRRLIVVLKKKEGIVRNGSNKDGHWQIINDGIPE